MAKSLKIFFLFSLFLAMFGFIKINPKKFFNPDLDLKISFLTVEESLSNNSFLIEPEGDSKNYVVFENEDLEDLEINVYAKTSSSQVNAIFIQAFLTQNTTKPTNPTNAPLNEEILLKLQKALSSLPCSDDINFLRSEFICNNYYKVNYTINTDGLNKIRKWLGYKDTKILLISIIPL
jgi:hypothetical protein